MGERLALGHRAPRPLREEMLHQLVDRGPASQRLRRVEQPLQPLDMMAADVIDAIGQVAERITMRRQHAADTFERVHPIERGEELVERVVDVAEPGDVRRDRRQHVIARQHDAFDGVVQAQVIRRVAGRVHGYPIAPGEADHLRVFELAGRRRHGPRIVHPRPHLLLLGVAHRLVHATPWLLAPHRTHEPLQSPFRFALGRAIGQLLRVGTVVVHLPHQSERLVADDVGAARLAQPRRAAEVVRVRMRHDHRVDPGHGDAGLAQAFDERVPWLFARQARVDEGEAVLVLQRVAVHVAEARQLDRQLHPYDAGRDLADLVGRGSGFLANGSGHD